MTHRNSVRNTLALCASLTLCPAVWGQANRSDFPPQALAKGIQQFKEKSFAQAAATFQAVGPRLPQLADYPSYFSGLAYVEQKNTEKAVAAFTAVVRFQPVSPFAARAAVSPAPAVRVRSATRSSATDRRPRCGRCAVSATSSSDAGTTP